MLLVTAVHAQLQDGSVSYSQLHAFKTRSETLAVTRPDVDSLKAADIKEEMLGMPYRFGYALPLAVDFFKAAEAMKVPGGTLYSLRLHAPGAVSVNLNFDRFYLAKDVKLWASTDDRSTVAGAFTSYNNNRHYNFAIAPVPGDAMMLELFEPAGSKGLSEVHISELVYGYRNDNPFDKAGFNQSGSCNINVNCSEADGWQNEAQAVIMLLTSGNQRKCTGSFVNNTSNDGKPYVLTARHCNTQTNSIFMFNYQSPECENFDGPVNMQLQGCEIVSENFFSDFSLLLLDQSPLPQYNTYYSGWNRDTLLPPNSFGIHHPNGDVKKFSVDSESVAPSTYLGNAVAGGNHWRVEDWNLGTTEAGSSGSPLFDAGHRIIGQLHGGFASCSNNNADYYGRFDVSWDQGADSSLRLDYWLDPGSLNPQALGGGYFYTPFYNLDVEITGISGVDLLECDASLTFLVSIVNWGSTVADSMTIRVAHEGINDEFVVSGPVAFGDTVVVPVSMTVNETGAYSFDFTVTDINGAPDEHPSDNNFTFDFERIEGDRYTLEVQTDLQPQTAVVQVHDEYGNMLNTFQDFAPDSLYRFELCFKDGCYRVVTYDSNGLCCGSGSGFTRLFNPEGTLIATASAFTDSVQFFICNPLYPDQSLFMIYPVPNDGNFSMLLNPLLLDDAVEIRIDNVAGQTMSTYIIDGNYLQTFSMKEAAAGVYIASVHSKKLDRTWVQKFLVVK